MRFSAVTLGTLLAIYCGSASGANLSKETQVFEYTSAVEAFSDGEFCTYDQAKALTITREKFLAAPDFREHGPGSRAGLSFPTIEKNGFTVTWLSLEDIRDAVVQLDDELDLNFDHFESRDFAAAGIGRTFLVTQCK
jgi:hypothetical protein